MEWALAIPRLQGISRLESPWGAVERDPMADVKEVLEERFGPVKFSRLYFGEEFCEKALAGRRELEEALSASGRAGMKFTYVTPYVTENGLTKLKELLTFLAHEEPRAEVVVNDWGVLDWLAEQLPTLTPVLGRLMNKVLRDPRMPKSLRDSSEKTGHSYQTSYLAGLGQQGLFDQYKVRRIELDHPPQGLDPELPDWGYRSSLYLPFGVVATGRICLMQSWGLEARDKFRTSGGCAQKCRFYWLEMFDPSRKVRKSPDWLIMQKGNTVFYRQSREFVKKALIEAEKYGVNRIVFQREPL